ncbi:GFA family protein [Sphingomonas desiccabilis]|uniref:GFA family protein n=1 Tax=Sphingomonas desiccabilis TaxID=429134 RepID=A0A4Q2IQG7_9SPHN|nr:GFA family protein [Sphingomonas desiccabilis]MBB3911207.1 hypothetical protein [Sphingomonas desiccabilis]RXZ31996.1 GFA family protein [Sphingomonas desiccabilis]
MRVRVASCRCGQLRATCTGEPVRVSVCHCLECQKRSGSAFAVQARWPDAQVALSGEFRTWSQQGDSGAGAKFRFCPTCGATLVYASEGMPGLTAVAVGAFGDPGFPAPHYSVWEDRKHAWVTVCADGMEHFA